MSYLTIEADQLVRNAVDAFVEGRLRPDVVADTIYSTRNSRYRIQNSVVGEASDTSLMGAELVGWLVEGAGTASIEPRWTSGARAIFVERAKSRHVVVTSRVITQSRVGRTSSGPPKEPVLRTQSIPPAPPIPTLKTGNTGKRAAQAEPGGRAPPGVVALGPEPIVPKPMQVPPLAIPDLSAIPDLAPREAATRDSDEEITRADYTEVHDAEQLGELIERTSVPSPTIPPEPDTERRPLAGSSVPRPTPRGGFQLEDVNDRGPLPPANPPKKNR
jgi:hypothetical protein